MPPCASVIFVTRLSALYSRVVLSPSGLVVAMIRPAASKNCWLVRISGSVTAVEHRRFKEVEFVPDDRSAESTAPLLQRALGLCLIVQPGEIILRRESR